MIPVRDVIPSRTSPAVTLALLAALGAACASPAVREAWLPWTAHGAAVWLAGGTLEDRLGHVRFAAFVAACFAAALAALLAAGHAADLLLAVGGAVAGMVAAYTVMFPRSRILMLVPVVVGLDVADVPAWVVFGTWAVLQTAAAWSAATWPDAAGLGGLAITAAAGATAGVLGHYALRRPERMRVDWWSP
jgi:membrane associated rhomboid family serine protease